MLRIKIKCKNFDDSVVATVNTIKRARTGIVFLESEKGYYESTDVIDSMVYNGWLNKVLEQGFIDLSNCGHTFEYY